MSILEKEFLSIYGWSDFFAGPQLESEMISQIVKPARVICEERNLYRLQISMTDSILASVGGKIKFNAKSREDYPAVGDWVWVEVSPQADRGIITQICKRRTMIQRKQVGAGSDIQILAANVDYIFLTTSVNDDLNYRRIERYLTLALNSGAKPVILLTKADVCKEDVRSVVANMQKQFSEVPVHSLSQSEFAAADFFTTYFHIGKTAVVVGSSGVGKSTLVNYLIGDGHVRTQAVREDDSKGRHTTTSRALYLTRFGGMVIDTPGMRELQLSDHSDGVEAQFADVEELMRACRFGNCQHKTEPGCAILQALGNKTLSNERWKSYHKLAAEVRQALRKQDKVLFAEDQKRWKKINVDARKAGKIRRGDDV